jgi:hypothetical protein
MAYKSSYVREVEKYFLSLVGKGIMLSSKDYNLITNWKRRGIPQEVIFRGISNAAQNLREKEDGTDLPHTLTRLVPFIEEEITIYWRNKKDKAVNIEQEKNNFIGKVAEWIAKTIKFEKRENVRRHYVAVRKRVMDLKNSKEEDVFRRLRQIEEDFYEKFFQALSELEKKRVELKAESMIAGRSRFMTDKARLESLLSFRNEILRKDYNLTKIIPND